MLDYPLDTSRAAWNLVVHNVTGRYPKIKWILAHSGGFIPFVAGRLSLYYSQRLRNTTREELLQRLKAFYVEIGYTGASQLPSVLDFVPEEQVLFGSDWPFQTEGWSYVSSVLDAFPLSVKQRNDIYFANAARLFKDSLA
jgi:predicted TIM-barrel fold metal-dependent hydrolase